MPIYQKVMKISNLIQKQQFNPNLLGIFVNPFYFARRGLFKDISNLAHRLKGKTLDVGCGSKPYKALFREITEYVGMEFDSVANRTKGQAEVFYNGQHFPFDDDYFDSVVATEVLEHVFNPDEFLSEISRVLKTDGQLLITTPFVWDEHEQPYDFARYSSFGLTHLLKKHSLEVVEHKKTNANIKVVFQIINCYIHKIIPFKNYKLRLFFYIIFISPFTILGIILSHLLPQNNDLYLSNVVLAKKI